MKRTAKYLMIFAALLLCLSFKVTAFAQVAPFKTFNYSVRIGDSLWKICQKYEIGASEILSVNPQITNPDMIYPNQVIKIPDLSEIKALEKQVLTIVNSERAKNGLKALSHNWQLSRVARYKSQDMIDKKYFSHTSPTYGSPFNMMKNFGINYRTGGENIAYGQRTPSEVMNSWMNSPGHRQNILSSNYSQLGVGVARSSSGQLYWTQMFIGW